MPPAPPLHSAAALMFQTAWDELPSADAPPSGGAYTGDVCKVRGEMYIFDGFAWMHIAKRTYCVGKLARKLPGP